MEKRVHSPDFEAVQGSGSLDQSESIDRSTSLHRVFGQIRAEPCPGTGVAVCLPPRLVHRHGLIEHVDKSIISHLPDEAIG